MLRIAGAGERGPRRYSVWLADNGNNDLGVMESAFSIKSFAS